MINTLYWADVVAIKYNLAFELIPVLLNMVVLDHNDHQIYLFQELVKIQNLIGYNRLLREERIKSL